MDVILNTTSHTSGVVTVVCGLFPFILCLFDGLVASSSGFIQCFYSILLLLFRAFSLLDTMVDVAMPACGPVGSVPVVPVCFSVTRP